MWFGFILRLGLAAQVIGAATYTPYPHLDPPLIPNYIELNRGQAPSNFLLFNSASSTSISSQSIRFSAYSLNLNFIDANPNPQLTTAGLLPGYANYFTGSDQTKWLHAMPLYSTITLSNIYPNIDASYIAGPSSGLKLQFICRPGFDPKLLSFNFDKSTRLSVTSPEGSLAVNLSSADIETIFTLQAPSAYQASRSPREISYKPQSNNNFAFNFGAYDATVPLYIEIDLAQPPTIPSFTFLGGFVFSRFPGPIATKTDAAGNLYYLTTTSGSRSIPVLIGVGTATLPDTDIPTDVQLYKFDPSGKLLWVTRLSGSSTDIPVQLLLLNDSSILVAGNTASPDFPTTPNALQRRFAGPFAPGSGTDIFLARINSSTGLILNSTYLGGPNSEGLDSIEVATDNSIFVIPAFPVFTAHFGLPTTPNSFSSNCFGSSCQLGYVARLNPTLSELIYATYLPGSTQVTKLHSDNSVYFGGWTNVGFPATPGSYADRYPGRPTAFLARIDPKGTNLIFGTYIPSSDFGRISQLAIAPDGSTWATLSFDATNARLLHLNSSGSNLLFSTPLAARSIAIDASSNVHTLSYDRRPTSPNALLSGPCGPLYQRRNAAGDLLYSTYLPSSAVEIASFTSNSNPLITSGYLSLSELNISLPAQPFLGCVVDAAYRTPDEAIVPGQIVTLFGSELGSPQGLSSQPVNGRLPTLLTGTRLLLNGEPMPLLYKDNWQINAIVPFSLVLSGRQKLQLEQDGRPGLSLELDHFRSASITLFLSDPSTGQAAAINEDGSLNSPSNPAKPGSRITLYGTGGGITVPPSTTGEITPLEKRLLAAEVEVLLNNSFPAQVEYAGAAPGLAAGVIQINLKLPAQIPQNPNYTRGFASLSLSPGPRVLDTDPIISVTQP